ncbi:MAG: PepSY domain-containing protein [Rudaea sp.]
MRRHTVIAAFLLAASLAAGTAWAAQLTLQQAIAKVERDTHGKVLSAETKHFGRRTIYRIKVLTRDGQVRVIEVPADNN